jgi:hypothetical protein
MGFKADIAGHRKPGYTMTRSESMGDIGQTQGQTREPQRGLTFEDVWAAMMETDRKFKEMTEETDRKMREMAEETTRKMREAERIIEETGLQMAATDKRVGELTNRFGRMVEHMIVPNLLTQFKALGFTFEVASQNVKITDENNKVVAEIDVFLENGDKAMIVEIKSTPSEDDIADHIERIEKLRRRSDIRGDTRKYLGAIAGVVVSDSVKHRALGKGLYVIVPSGDTFAIIKPEGKYHVREW